MNNSRICIIACFVSIAMLFSCNKEKIPFGTEVLQDDDFIGAYVDSTSVTVSYIPVKDDSIRSSKITYMIGSTSFADGTQTRADFMSRFYFTSLTAPLKECTLDSICFIMYERSQYIGDTNKTQTIQIYELTDSITKNHCKAYYEDAVIPQNLVETGLLIGQKSYKPVFDTSSNFSFKFPQQYAANVFARIQAIYDQTKDVQTIDSLFIKTFKGLYVTSAYQNAAILNVYPQISIYVSKGTTKYRVDLAPTATPYTATSTKDPSLVYLQALSMFHHIYSTEVTSTLNSKGDVAYVQGFSGIKTRVALQGIGAWQDSSVVFNSIKLYVPYVLDTKPNFAPAKMPQLLVYNPLGTKVLTLECYTYDSTYYIYNLNALMPQANNNKYNPNNYMFELVMPENNLYGNMLKIDALVKQSKLKIIYTK